MGGYPKQPMYRVAYTKLSEAQIADKLKPAMANGPSSASVPAEAFAGKSIRIVTDKGPALAYQFSSAGRLKVSENGAKPVDAGYLTAVKPGTVVIVLPLDAASTRPAVGVPIPPPPPAPLPKPIEK